MKTTRYLGYIVTKRLKLLNHTSTSLSTGANSTEKKRDNNQNEILKNKMIKNL